MDVHGSFDSLQCDVRAFGWTLVAAILLISWVGSCYFRVLSEDYLGFLMISAAGVACPPLFQAWRVMEKKARARFLFCLLYVFIFRTGCRSSNISLKMGECLSKRCLPQMQRDTLRAPSWPGAAKSGAENHSLVNWRTHRSLADNAVEGLVCAGPCRSPAMPLWQSGPHEALPLEFPQTPNKISGPGCQPCIRHLPRCKTG